MSEGCRFSGLREFIQPGEETTINDVKVSMSEAVVAARTWPDADCPIRRIRAGLPVSSGACRRCGHGFEISQTTEYNDKIAGVA